MTIIKITIVAWALTFILYLFVKSNLSRADLIHLSLNDGEFKMTFWRWMFVLLFVTSIGLTVVSIIWFLFFSGVI